MTLTPAHVATYIQYTRYPKDKQYSDALIKQTIELISKHKVVVSNIIYKVDEGYEYILAKPHSDTTSLWLFLVAGKEVGYKGALNLPNTEYEKGSEISALMMTEKLAVVSTLNIKTRLHNTHVFKQIFKHRLANSYEYNSTVPGLVTDVRKDSTALRTADGVGKGLTTRWNISGITGNEAKSVPVAKEKDTEEQAVSAEETSGYLYELKQRRQFILKQKEDNETHSLALQKELQTCFKVNEAYEKEVDLLEQLINICKPNL